MFIPFQLILHKLAKSYQPAYITKQLHALIGKTHLSRDPFYATRIVRLYALNNDLPSARKLFDEMPIRSIFLWNSIIRAYARAHDFRSAFWLFAELVWSDSEPDNFTYACMLRTCCENGNLDGLRLVHGQTVASGFGSEPICCSTLVSAYSKLGLVDEAEKVFCGADDKDLPMCNAMISGYGYSGFVEKGFKLFNGLRNFGMNLDGYTLVGLLMGIASPCLLQIGQGIHSLSLKSSFDHSAHVGSSLVSMYSRCSCLDSAYKVFANLLQPDLVTWSSLITGFSQSGDHQNALLFFREMNMGALQGDPVLIASVLAASSQLALSGPGCEIHGYILRQGLERDIMVSSALIDMYHKCGFVDLAMKCFEMLSRRNTVSYNTMILGLGSNGLASQAFNIFNELLEEGLKPDHSTLSSLLHACSFAGLVKDAKGYFQRFSKQFGIEPSIDHYVHMVRLMGMSGELEEAYNLILSLPEPVDEGLWGALLACCEAQGDTSIGEMVAGRLFESNDGKLPSYRVMLSNIYADTGRWHDVERLREDMVDFRQKKIPGFSWIA